MLTPKNPQKSLPATIAHMNDLLDEALKETFPASDPSAINIDVESPEHGITITPGFSRCAQRHTQDAAEAVGRDGGHRGA
jgi:hypothetical protein